VSGRRGRRRKLLLNLRKGGYWKLKEEAPVGTTCRTHFGRGYGLVVDRLRNKRHKREKQWEGTTGANIFYNHLKQVRIVKSLYSGNSKF